MISATLDQLFVSGCTTIFQLRCSIYSVTNNAKQNQIRQITFAIATTQCKNMFAGMELRSRHCLYLSPPYHVIATKLLRSAWQNMVALLPEWYWDTSAE